MKNQSEKKLNYYHIYNRGVDKRIVFKNNSNYLHFLELIRGVNRVNPIGSLYHQKQIDKKAFKEENVKLIEILTYSLLPNHYHVLLKELTEGGVSKFMQKIGTGYTNYFNFKNKRSGSLFQGKYKSVLVDNENYLNYLSAYICGNAEIHGISKAQNYNYSNYNIILSGKATSFNKNIIENFSSINEYKNYVSDVVKNSKQKKNDIKFYTIE